MKKKLLIGCLSVVALASAVIIVSDILTTDGDRVLNSLVRENVKALMDNESTGVYGHCSEKSNACIAKCGNCGAVYEAIGHVGGAYKMSGKCSECKENM